MAGRPRSAFSSLSPGDRLTAESSGSPCVIKDLIGAGGQGEVYRGLLDGEEVAVKWYYPNWSTAQQRRSLELLIGKGSPSDRFLWPSDMVSVAGNPSYGYLMPLRPPRFRSMTDLLKGRIEPTFRARATAGLQLAHSFHQLHSRGLCYRDISAGNVFLDPATGDIAICDNDNVGVDQEGVGGVMGTPDFMAPELVRNEGVPNTQSDLFSLSVLLFYIFHIHHPLYGKRLLAIRSLDLKSRVKLCGEEPVFIFDPTNASNEALPWEKDPTGEAGGNAYDLWRIYPEFLREKFLQAFTVGLKDPKNGRVRETEWKVVMAQLRDDIAYCPSRHENFVDREVRLSGPARPRLPDADTKAAPPPPGEPAPPPPPPLAPCWVCASQVARPPRLRFGKSWVILNADTVVYPHHVDPQRLYDYSTPVASVNQHPSDPSRWGIKNLTAKPWTSVLPDGTSRVVEPGKSVSIALGTRIRFPTSEGVIEA